MTTHLTAYAAARERAVAAWLGQLPGLRSIRESAHLSQSEADVLDHLLKVTENLDDAYTAAQNRRRTDGTWGHAPEVTGWLDK